MNPTWSSPVLHGDRARRVDARISGGMTVIGSMVALAMAHSSPLPALAYGFALTCILIGLLIVRFAVRVPGWVLSGTNVMGSAGVTSVAVHAPDGYTFASGPILFVIAALQVGLLRGRRESWAQLAWALVTYVVGLHLVGLPASAVVAAALPVAVSLAVVTVAVTRLRARVLALGDDLTRSIAELRSQAEHDPLTGLLNRQGLVRRAALPSVLLEGSVLLLDVDHFKRINDERGHQAGDDVLARLGPVLAGVPNGQEMAVRVGGEEFLLVLRGTDLEAARARAEEVRGLAARALSSAGVGRVTVSVGVATGAFGATFEEVYRRADEALYRAKRTGRDRVVVDDAPAPGIPRPATAATRESLDGAQPVAVGQLEPRPGADRVPAGGTGR
ncbi:GGDEF domain-containing protein [Cellulomonas aerilata]|uniref:GGDEF domain-containing protein n=1 Tax=Cellulomonas aerilata TaxID=515326 RepID=UPI0011BE195D|nr:GGDEF domain-containing protein [Cellulomonas aerilata]